jgi:hypothetical protein
MAEQPPRTWSAGTLPPKEKNYDYDQHQWSVNEEWGIIVKGARDEKWTYITQIDKPVRQETGRGARAGSNFLGVDGVYLDLTNYVKTAGTPEEIDEALTVVGEGEVKNIKSMKVSKARLMFCVVKINKALKAATSKRGK